MLRDNEFLHIRPKSYDQLRPTQYDGMELTLRSYGNPRPQDVHKGKVLFMKQRIIPSVRLDRLDSLERIWELLVMIQDMQIWIDRAKFEYYNYGQLTEN